MKVIANHRLSFESKSMACYIIAMAKKQKQTKKKFQKKNRI